MSIVVATRSGLASSADGSKYRLARGRTLADSRHALVQEHPELWAPYHIELSVDEPDGGTPTEGSAAAQYEAAEAEATAERYREQLAAIAEGLHARGLVPADVDTDREGWLADLVFAVIDEPSRAAADDGNAAPEVAKAAEPEKLPAPRKRARPRAVAEE